MIFHEYFDRRIPDLSALRADKFSYKTLQINEIQESCVRVRPEICRSYYWYHEMRPRGASREIFLRRSLVLKLEKIIDSLKSLGLGVLIQEGYRPLCLQNFVEEVSVKKQLEKENPGISVDELREKIKMFAASANGDLRISPPPHLTGGAVDLKLVYLDSLESVDMGKGPGLFKTAFPDALEKIEGYENPRKFRRLLYWLAHKYDIVTNPTEWWHLSYGDQMWAWALKKQYAFYGAASNFTR